MENNTPNFMHWSKPGKAIITGASSGIGATFARKFAQQGFSLVLIDIQQEALLNVADDLRNLYHVDIITLIGDLSKENRIIELSTIFKAYSNVDILVNNAGFGSKGYFANNNFERQLAMHNVHNLAPIYFTRAVLAGMIERNRGVIINLGSVGGFLPSAGAVMYASTKAFTIMFSESIALELQGTDVRIQALCPGFTRTEFHNTEEKKGFDKSAIPNFMWMTAEEVVDKSLVGIQNNQVVLLPGWKVKVLKLLQTSLLTRKAAMQKTIKTAQK